MDVLSKIWAPFKALFQDRVFVTGLVSAIAAVLISFVPALESQRDLIITLGVAVVILAAGGQFVVSSVTAYYTSKAVALRAEAELVKAQAAHG